MGALRIASVRPVHSDTGAALHLCTLVPVRFVAGRPSEPAVLRCAVLS